MSAKPEQESDSVGPFMRVVLQWITSTAALPAVSELGLIQRRPPISRVAKIDTASFEVDPDLLSLGAFSFHSATSVDTISNDEGVGSSRIRREARFSSTSLENHLNNSSFQDLSKNFSQQLLSYIKQESPEPGLLGPADKLINRSIERNTLATMSWLNSMFLENYGNVRIAADIILLTGRLPYDVARPTGVTMAIAGLNHQSAIVVEAAIRAFEGWANLDSLHALENLRVPDGWLSRYLEEVKSDIKSQLCPV